MKPKRLFVAVPVAVVLAIVGFSVGAGPLTPSTVQIAGFMFPSDTPTATATSVPTWTPAPTDTPTPLPSPTATFVPTITPIPGPTRDVNLRSARVPILMYHYTSVPPPDADIYRLDLSVTPAALDAQMAYLAQEGYHPIRVSDLSDYLLKGKLLPTKPIVLTFDDGYSDNYDNALPILKKYKFTATFFIIAGFVDDKRPGYMNWDQIEDLAINGMEIGSHSLNHIDLHGKPRSVQTTEVAGSKALIEARIGTPVTSFCYPSGEYDALTISVLRSSGYLAATTEIQGTYQATNDMYQLRRIRVRGSYSVSDFAYWIKYFLASGK